MSVLTIVAFSTERFLAICYPLHLYAMSGFKRAVRIIVLLWFISCVSAMPFGWYSTIHYIEYPPGEYECSCFVRFIIIGTLLLYAIKQEQTTAAVYNDDDDDDGEERWQPN